MTRIIERLRVALTSTKFLQRLGKTKSSGFSSKFSSKVIDSHQASTQSLESKGNLIGYKESEVNLNINQNVSSQNNIPQNNTPIFDWLGNIIISSAGVTALVLGAREIRWLERWELIAYDQMTLMRPVETLDRRLVIVKVNEEDVEKYGYPLSNDTVNQLLNKIQSHKPKVIGLNIESSADINIGNAQNFENVIVDCTQSSMGNQEIAPMSNFPRENIGFGDIVTDSDNVVRRSLLFANPQSDKKCKTEYSFATALAYNYLPSNIDFRIIDEKHYKLGNISLPALQKTSGSYKKLDNRGYQIMLSYRNPKKLAQQFTLSEVLHKKVKPTIFKDKLVIIGTVARSKHTGFDTPYTTSEEFPNRTPSVLIHAQIASQIISAILDKRSFIWYLSEHFEALWIWFWAGIGATLAWHLKHPGIIMVAGIIVTGSLIIFCYIIFLQSGWIPLVPAAISLFLSTITTMSYLAYCTQSQTKLMILQVEKQQEAMGAMTLKGSHGAIAQLNTMGNIGYSSADTGKKLDTFHDPEPLQTFSTSFLLSGRYQITRVLGKGGFGCTYLAKDTQRPGNPTCVVKQLMPARQDTKFMEVARRLFDSEAEILEILGKHSQIPELLAFFEDNQEFYLVQEFIRGRSLEEELSPVKGQHNEKFVIEMLADILEVLAYVHEHQVIHRDIKPSNIIRNKQNNHLVLIDFGAVKQMQPSNNENTELATVAIGTKGYTPPEQFAGHPRLSSDIYAVGIIAIQALTGIPPQQFPVNPDTGNIMWHKQAQASKTLTAIIDTMVCYHFSNRYQSAREALEDLQKIQINL